MAFLPLLLAASRTLPIALRGSIVGLIWLTRVRSDINQRANILRGPDNVQPARWRSFYRRRKTIRIYIRAREKGITYSRVSAACVREKGSLSLALALFVGLASSVRRVLPLHRGSRNGIWYSLLERRPRQRSNYRAFARRLLRMHLG